MTERTKWAARGDTIQTTVQNPMPATITMRLDTPEACAMGNELIASGRWTLHDLCADVACSICNEKRQRDQEQ